MHNIKIVFDKMYPIVEKFLKNKIDTKGNIIKLGRKPKFSDLSIITLSLVSESLGIDSEIICSENLKSNTEMIFPL